MPTLNPRITFTVSNETMKAIDEYRFSHRMRNQTQAILSLIDLGFKRPRVQISPPRPKKSRKHNVFGTFSFLDNDEKWHKI